MNIFREKWKSFHEGRLSKEEVLDLLRELNEEDTEKLFEEYLRNSWNEESGKEDSFKWDGSEVFKRIVDKKAEKKRKTKVLDYPAKTYPRTLRWVAAIFLIIFSWQYGKVIFNQGSSNPPLLEEEPAFNWVTKSNPNGRKSKILLPDSSVIYLNAGSQVRYRNDFTSFRKVWLEGEAFFEVAKDSLHPFSVQTGRILTTALGTSFNINAYDNNKVNVGLASGLISVTDSVTRQDIQLQPGEGAYFSTRLPAITKHTIDPEKISWWKDGILYLEKIQFEDLIGILEKWYGVEIEVRGPIPDDRCSGTFKKNEFLSNVLKVLGHSVGFSYSIDGRNVIINVKTKIE
ncbi:FecR family protein [Negadavirga shengliensis]|uniref:FecR family protein n=1 Tax=Negadavirga shengliensis TaxID=1389218 RepID=A0ABV9T6Y2_9BACT